MSKKDYTRFAKQVDEPVKEVEEVIDEVIEAETKEPVIGVVSDCLKLNVRKRPSIDSDVLFKLDCLTEVMIEDDSDEEFYKVYTTAGIAGYCMKKYISIRS